MEARTHIDSRRQYTRRRYARPQGGGANGRAGHPLGSKTRINPSVQFSRAAANSLLLLRLLRRWPRRCLRCGLHETRERQVGRLANFLATSVPVRHATKTTPNTSSWHIAIGRVSSPRLSTRFFTKHLKKQEKQASPTKASVPYLRQLLRQSSSSQCDWHKATVLSEHF